LRFGCFHSCTGKLRQIFRRERCHASHKLSRATHSKVESFISPSENKTLLGTLRPVVLAGQILGPLVGEFAGAQSRGLTDFDQVAVGVPHVTANLSTAIDRRRHKLGPF